MRNVIAYYRVSTNKQDTKMQKHSVKNFAKKLNLNIIEELEDDGLSGVLGYDDRPAIKELRALFDQKKELNINGIIIFLWDRFSREKRFALNFQCDLEDYEMKLFESGTEKEMDLTELGFQLTTTVNTIVAVEERKKMKIRLKAKIKQIQDGGGKWGRPKNYGLVPGSIGRQIKKEPTFWRNYLDFRLRFKMSKSATARLLRIPRATLYIRIDEDFKQKDLSDKIYCLIKNRANILITEEELKLDLNELLKKVEKKIKEVE